MMIFLTSNHTTHISANSNKQFNAQLETKSRTKTKENAKAKIIKTPMRRYKKERGRREGERGG
jgi:hypothetical protein